MENEIPATEQDPENTKSPPAEDLEQILRMAWRPAWSMRSRRGCLAPFIDWWQRRNDAPDKH